MERPTCKTCPYFFCPPFNKRGDRSVGINVNGECRRSPRYHERHSDCWCGKHPDFPEWLESQKKERPAPTGGTEVAAPPVAPPAPSDP
ncbi:MAG: hypothetical protein U0939_00985 [Pirellulales bacterium]